MTEPPQKASVLAHEKEKEYLEGRIPPFKATLADAPDSPYPAEMKAAFLSQKFDYLDYTVTVDRTLEDGEELPFCGGITIIHVPGHTPGHICLYIRQSKTSVAGDALSAEGGKLGPPNFASLDWRLALRSLDKYTRLRFSSERKITSDDFSTSVRNCSSLRFSASPASFFSVTSLNTANWCAQTSTPSSDENQASRASSWTG